MTDYENYGAEEYQNEIKEISLQLSDMLEAALYFAGVKKARLEEAMDAYLDEMDEALGGDEDAVMGFEEIVRVIKHLKNTRKDLFA
ncbi:MAG: hypothetical protein LBF71_00255 [Campylobacteraceae bacterium]|jgi:ElaB/YqjD/DUF883 family membrane-anchored ribosome-binding protein|nr:hypothetical protein [Campylobacteraceae bacterium]